MIVIYDNNQDTLTHHNQERDLWATKKPPDYQKKLMSPYQDFYIWALNILQDETLPVQSHLKLKAIVILINSLKWYSLEQCHEK